MDNNNKSQNESFDLKKIKIKLPTLKNTGFKSLGVIVKIIAFLVALAVLSIHIVAAYILFEFKPVYSTICIAIIALGFLISLIVLFLIYALGHSICQNNEILKILKK